MPRTATIGPAIYQRVNELVSEGSTRTEAFAQVAQERGQQAGTVSANYYRTARSQGQTGRASKNMRRRPAKSGTRGPVRTAVAQSPGQATSGARSTASHDDIAQIAAQIALLTQQLVKQVQDRDARLRKLLG
jgi:hypothetical protein